MGITAKETASGGLRPGVWPAQARLHDCLQVCWQPPMQIHSDTKSLNIQIVVIYAIQNQGLLATRPTRYYMSAFTPWVANDIGTEWRAKKSGQFCLGSRKAGELLRNAGSPSGPTMLPRDPACGGVLISYPAQSTGGRYKPPADAASMTSGSRGSATAGEEPANDRTWSCNGAGPWHPKSIRALADRGSWHGTRWEEEHACKHRRRGTQTPDPAARAWLHTTQPWHPKPGSHCSSTARITRPLTLPLAKSQPRHALTPIPGDFDPVAGLRYQWTWTGRGAKCHAARHLRVVLCKIRNAGRTI